MSGGEEEVWEEEEGARTVMDRWKGIEMVRG